LEGRLPREAAPSHDEWTVWLHTGDQAVVARDAEEARSVTARDLIAFVDALPKTGSGKVDKKKLREPHWKGEEKRVR
jgi:acyl-coenzyme A synthetase/AMP-(fatty) acid ligase